LMKLWETGELIAQVCQKHLGEAATKLDDFPESN
jgi:exonuclease VII small subunit